jgi:hypothetical protein
VIKPVWAASSCFSVARPSFATNAFKSSVTDLFIKEVERPSHGVLTHSLRPFSGAIDLSG